MTDNSISKLIEMAKTARFTDAQKEEQRRSFVYGNVAFENERVTPEMVERQAEKTKS